MKKSIVWLASYPKSGNTWLRSFLANYLVNAASPVPINEVHKFGLGDNITQMYRRVATGPVDLNDVEASVRLRPRVLAAIVANNADVNLVKTHNINRDIYGVQLIPAEVTRSAIYVMRNPLDMVLSYAKHTGQTIEKAAQDICHPHNGTAPYEKNVATFLGSWSDHVKSWTQPLPYPVLVLRYEDMLANPAEAFGKVVEHFGMTVDQERLERAIRHCSFDELRKQEEKSGFIEKSEHSDRFFSKGQAGHWRTELDPELARTIRQSNKRMMKQYGYWND